MKKIMNNTYDTCIYVFLKLKLCGTTSIIWGLKNINDEQLLLLEFKIQSDQCSLSLFDNKNQYHPSKINQDLIVPTFSNNER